MQRHTKKEWKTQTGVQLHLWKWTAEQEKELFPAPLNKLKQKKPSEDQDDDYLPFL